MARASSWLRPLTASLSVSTLLFALPTEVQGQQQGSWSPVHDWGTQINSYSSCPPDKQLELVHANLIPRDTFRGHVLLWRKQQDPASPNCGFTKNTDTFWIANPNDLTNLIRVYQPLNSDLFCAGQSWDSYGRLVVAGGVPGGCAADDTVTHPGNPCQLCGATGFPPETYRFYPDTFFGVELDGNGYPDAKLATADLEAWRQVGDMAMPRYYPTLFQLNKDATYLSTNILMEGGSQMVAGGPPCVDPSGDEVWELLRSDNSGSPARLVGPP